MSTKKMTYEELYQSMAKKFIIEKNETDYTLGEYMLMRARSKKENSFSTSVTAAGTNLPVVKNAGENGIVAVFSYVNEKLKVKEAPVKNKTMRSFPLRTSASAFCSALVICAIVIGCGFFGLKSVITAPDNTVSVNENEDEEKKETTSEENTVMAYFEIAE